ncbi:uncharacterized protein [Littorina saxatilis]|uniref:Receptor ligand binding region domain-containing protein n=1 Tax=Littorina saxatilis TaxID=31220 RepID=A0AAN9GC10_9CAEN
METHNPYTLFLLLRPSPLLLLFVGAILSTTQPANANTAESTCSLGRTSWNPDAPARFGLSISLRKADQILGCGLVSQEALQLYVAAQWVCEKLNADPHGNGSFIPGVQFGFDLLDDCRSSTRAVQYALDYVDLYSGCQAENNSSPQLRLGIVGPTRSSTAEETADSMRSIPIPIISPSATLASLTEGGTPHPNFFRTVPSDKVQIKAIVAILKELRWTFLAVVYTDDNYGVMGSQALREEASKANICINDSIPIGKDTDLNNVVAGLINTRNHAEGQSMAVVYIGEKDKAENLMFNVRSRKSYGLHFIMSDSVSTNTDVFDSGGVENGQNIALGSLTLSPSSIVFQEFETYLNKKYQDVKDGREQDQAIKAFLDSTIKPGEQYEQIPFVPLVVSAVFALAEAARQAHLERCSGNTGVCDELATRVQHGDILDRLKDIQVDFGAMDPSVAPAEYRQKGYVLEFNDNGDVKPKTALPDYTVYSFDHESDPPYLHVGSYSGGALTLSMDRVRMLTKDGQVTSSLQTSVCSGNCAECADNGMIPMAHINGSAYIIGIFSMHERNANQPFKCGDFRNVSNDAIVLEAFLETVEQMRRKTGIDFGAVAFDDCYSSLHITSVLSDFQSGLVPFDKGLFDVCVPQDKVVGVVGCLSSDATLSVASFFTPQRIPTISYASSSPDLDDTINYPYFLRTVPSDEEQAIAMTELIQVMGWEYVGLLYVSNNYGTKGARAFQRAAYDRGVCVASPVAISVNPTNVDEKHLYDAFVALMQQNVKVVVFFGIDTRMADFLRLIESREEQGNIVFIASEEWGTKTDVLAAGKKAARGSITFKVDNTNVDEDTLEALHNRLRNQKPSNQNVNPWFSEFWQHIFDCNIPGGFNNIFQANCDANQRLSVSQVDTMLSDQRVKHVMNAVKAMAEGLAAAKVQICEDSFPCPFLRSDKYANDVFDSIKSQTVSLGSNKKEELFDERGNGNIGFSIYNIKRSTTNPNNYEYELVGGYSKKDGLSVNKEKIVFYKDTGLQLDSLTAVCSDDVCPADCAKAPEEVVTPAPIVKTDDDFRVADLVILIVLVVVCLLLVCGMCVGFNYFRKKVRGLSKELQDQKNEPVYDMARTPQHHVTYSNMDAALRGLSLPLPPRPIQFVNGGMTTCSNSPGDTLDGHTNPSFLSDNALNRCTPAVSESSLVPTTRRRASPPPPPPPNRSPAPPFHHSMSAAPRLERDQASNDSNTTQHDYYMAHSLSSHRELPDVPGGRGENSGVNSPTRALRSLQSMPAGSHGNNNHQHRGGEDIALQSLRRQFNNDPSSLHGGDLKYLNPTEFDSSRFTEGNGNNGNVQYFHMAPSGRLQEEQGEDEDEEEPSDLNTYSLSPHEDDRSTLNAYPMSPQMTRAAAAAAFNGYPARQSLEGPPRERSESLTPVSYSGVIPQRQRSESANFPPNMYNGVIPPLHITSEMRDMLLHQLLADKGIVTEQSYNSNAGSSLQSPSSSSVGSTSPTYRQQQRQNSCYRQQPHPASAHYPSTSQPMSSPALSRSSYPQHSYDDRHTLYGGYPSSTQGGHAQSMQTGIYAPFSQLPDYSMGPQVASLPQTNLSTPYAQLAQGGVPTSQEPEGGAGSRGEPTLDRGNSDSGSAASGDTVTQDQHPPPVNFTLQSLESLDDQSLQQQDQQPQGQQQQQQQQQEQRQQQQQQQQQQPQHQLQQPGEPNKDASTPYGMQLNITRV